MTILTLKNSLTQESTQKTKSTIDPVIAEQDKIMRNFNSLYCAVIVGGKNLVIRTESDANNRKRVAFFSHDEFIKSYRNADKTPVYTGKNDREGNKVVKYINPAKFWLDNPARSSAHNGVTFDPSTTKRKVDGRYNTHFGTSVAPSKFLDESMVQPYLDHVYKIICSNDKAIYEYVISWIAHMFQKPNHKPQVCLFLKAGQGTGKGAFVEPLGRILSSHYFHAKKAKDVTGNFNSSLENMRLVFGDEMWAGRKGETDILKTLITEKTNNIERKGIDKMVVPCYMRLIMSSNHDTPIRVERDERRYVYIEVSEDKKRDMDYFIPLFELYDQKYFLNNLLKYFLDHDISDFIPQVLPKNAALHRQKLDNLDVIERWFLDLLRDVKRYPVRVTTVSMVESLNLFMQAENLSVHGDKVRRISEFFRRAKLGDSKNVRVGGKIVKGRFLPEIDEARELFQKYIGCEIEW